MKTISGKLISTKPISLSRAARNLSGFASHENGASDAVSVYLKRAADAFNTLVSFHKDLKNPHSASNNRTIEENLDDTGKSKKNPDFGVEDEKVKIEEKTKKKKKPKKETVTDGGTMSIKQESGGIQQKADEFKEESGDKRGKKKRKMRKTEGED